MDWPSWSLLVHHVLQHPYHHRGSPLEFLFYVCIFPTLGSSKLHPIFQICSHFMDGNSHFSQTASYSFPMAAQDALDLLCCKITADLLVVHQNFQISFWKSFPIALASKWLFCTRCGMLLWHSLDFVRFLPALFCSLLRLFRALAAISHFAVICSSSHPWSHWPCFTVPTPEVHWPPAGPAPAHGSPWDQWCSQCSTLSST